ncbi:MAG TPA: L,D-transpeptidase family protein [Thermodesulfovibrionales bacterium]|nr:L,D-transpeptidase family protein [Thermodesulfovibrionales bacterium]
MRRIRRPYLFLRVTERRTAFFLSPRVTTNRILVFILSFLPFVLFAHHAHGSSVSSSSPDSIGGNGVGKVVRTVGPDAEARLKPYFDRVGIAYPPDAIALIGLKEEKRLELWAERDGAWLFVRAYDVLAASGVRGPKQRRGDRQVPEGVYQIVSLNARSRFHLSMKLNYPNSFDLEKARDENRSNLGGDIFIHGKAKSSGCLAVGDRAIEELFVLVARVGTDNTKVLILPQDLRKGSLDEGTVYKPPPWLPELYRTLEHEIVPFRVREYSGAN